METTVNIKNLSKEERAQLLAELQNEEKQSRIQRRETYESLRAELLHGVEERLQTVAADVQSFHDWLQSEVEGFVGVMRDYGQLLQDRHARQSLSPCYLLSPDGSSRQ